MKEKIIELKPKNTSFLRNFLDVKKHLATTVPTLLLLIAGIYWISSKRDGAVKGYLSVKEAWQKGDVETVRALIKKYPELHASYDGQIAQQELAKGPSKLAEKRAKGKSSFDLFAQTATTIAKGKFEKALVESEKLKAAIDSSSDLYAFTLLRIAVLHGELGDKEAETEAWEEVEKCDSFPNLVDHFQDQQVSLQEYVLGRR